LTSQRHNAFKSRQLLCLCESNRGWMEAFTLRKHKHDISTAFVKASVFENIQLITWRYRTICVSPRCLQQL